MHGKVQISNFLKCEKLKKSDRKLILTLQTFILNNFLGWVVNILIQFSSNRPQSY